MEKVIDLKPAINGQWLKKQLGKLDPEGFFVIDEGRTDSNISYMKYY